MIKQLALLLCFIVVTGLWAIVLGQDLNWDLLQYHFYNGYAFMQHRSFSDVAAATMQTYLNPFFDVINYLLIRLNYPLLTEFLLGAFSGVSAFFLYQIILLFLQDRTASERFILTCFAMMIGLTGAAHGSVINATTNDTKMAMLIIIALFCALKALTINSSTKRYLYFATAGFLIGLATGFKLTAACYGLGFFIALLLTVPRLSVLYAVSSLSGFLLANGYWMFLLYQHFQNPFFPYLNNIFHSPFAPHISFNLSASPIPLQLSHYLLLPFYLAKKNTFTSEQMLSDSRLFIIYLLALFVILKERFTQKTLQMSPQSKFLVYFCTASYCFWLILFTVYRYLLPLELLSGLIIVYLAVRLFPKAAIHFGLISIICCYLLLSTHYPDWGNRVALQKTFISVEQPHLPPHATVLLTGLPLSYAIPFFPADCQFIGLPFLELGVTQINEESIAKHKWLREVMSDIVANKEKMHLYSLSFARSNLFFTQKYAFLNISHDLFKHYGLKEDEEHCQLLKTNVGDTLRLCPL